MLDKCLDSSAANAPSPPDARSLYNFHQEVEHNSQPGVSYLGLRTLDLEVATHLHNYFEAPARKRRGRIVFLVV